MTFDLQILRGSNQPTPSVVAYASPPLAMEGTAKIAQKFAHLFLREYDPVRNRGTQFPGLMKTGQILTDSAVITNFTAAVLRIIRELGDQSELPGSEQIARADLTSHALSSDLVTLNVRLTTGDGTVDFVLPVQRV